MFGILVKSFSALTYRRKAACTIGRGKKTIFNNKCELLKCCSYGKHLDRIHLNIKWNVFGRSVCKIEKKSEAESYVVRILCCL